MSDLEDKLEELAKSDYVPLHMPGAKRNSDIFRMVNPYSLDITEIDGFDNLHHANGIIKDGFKRASMLFNADETLFLINGSSSGIMAAICGATSKREKVIVARNVHCSVMNAVYLNELDPVYIIPEPFKDESQVYDDIYGAIDPKQIEILLRNNKEIKTVIITSPTYEGVVSDIKSISNIVHSHDGILIVDEAHGAHFNFNKNFPQSAVTLGADIVIQSIHKTLPAFTQTALLHINSSCRCREKVKMYWNMFQTTSPSYILMAGIDRCMSILEKDSKILFDNYTKMLVKLRNEISQLKYIKLVNTDDISKIVLWVADGKKIYRELREKHHIQLEMASIHYVIAMTSIGDKQEYYDRFICALKQLDVKSQKYTEFREKCEKNSMYRNVSSPVIQKNIYDALNSEKEYISLSKCIGRISGSYVCFYPPGINLLNPGEVITESVLNIIKDGIMKKIEVIGIKNTSCDEDEILCLK